MATASNDQLSQDGKGGPCFPVVKGPSGACMKDFPAMLSLYGHASQVSSCRAWAWTNGCLLQSETSFNSPQCSTTDAGHGQVDVYCEVKQVLIVPNVPQRMLGMDGLDVSELKVRHLSWPGTWRRWFGSSGI